MTEFKKLTDVAWNDTDINRFSRLDRYWTRKSSVLRGKIHERSTKVYVSTAVEKIGLTAGDMMREYKLKGVEFGRWLNVPERYDHFCSGMLALEDLAAVLGTRNLGLDHHIGLAFGARGNGGRAMAHFEPRSMMINLTKELGATSCLAHEYGHALDFFFGMFIDTNPYTVALSGGRIVGANTYFGKKGKYRKMMQVFLDRVMATDSYKRWHKYPNLRPYWCNHTEMFARCFEQWVADELKSKGVVNTYLTSECEMYTKLKMYLSDNDKKTVYPEIKRLVKEMAKAANEK